MHPLVLNWKTLGFEGRDQKHRNHTEFELIVRWESPGDISNPQVPLFQRQLCPSLSTNPMEKIQTIKNHDNCNIFKPNRNRTGKQNHIAAKWLQFVPNITHIDVLLFPILIVRFIIRLLLIFLDDRLVFASSFFFLCSWLPGGAAPVHEWKSIDMLWVSTLDMFEKNIQLHIMGTFEVCPKYPLYMMWIPHIFHECTSKHTV